MKKKMTKEEWEAEVEATVTALPSEPPEETVDILHERGLIGSNILLYSAAMVHDPLENRSRKMVKAHCTFCGEEVYLEHVPIEGGCHMSQPPAPFGFDDPLTKELVYHGLSCLCPSCGAGVEAIHIGRFRHTYEIESVCCLSLHNVRGHLALLAWVIVKECNKQGETFFIKRPYEGMFLIGGKPIRVSAHKNNMGYGHVWLSKFERRKRFDIEIGDWVFDEIINPDIDLIEGTDCAHSALGEYMRNCGGKISPACYLLMWNKFPCIENLTRNGCSVLLSDLIDYAEGYGNSYSHKVLNYEKIKEQINTEAVKPHEILGIEKGEMHLARGYSLFLLEFYKWVKAERGLRLDEEQLKRADIFKLSTLKELLSGKWGRFIPPVVRTVNYLIKRRKIYGGFDAIGYLRDYWDMLLKVYRRMPEELIYPKDLKRAHDEVMLRIKEKENKELTRKIKERFDSLDALSYSSEALGLLIRPAASQAELITEGKILHHCVAGYAANHANGKTSIFFIRHINDPEMPFYTLEYKNGKVEQNRGEHNCTRTEDVIAFEAEWLNHIRNLKEISI